MPCDNFGQTACCAGPCAKLKALARDPLADPRPGDVWSVPDTRWEDGKIVPTRTEVTVKYISWGGEVYFHYPGWHGAEWHAPSAKSSFPLWSEIAKRNGWEFVRHAPNRTQWKLNPYGGWGGYPSLVFNGEVW